MTPLETLVLKGPRPSCDVKTQAENLQFKALFSARKDRITWWIPYAELQHVFVVSIWVFQKLEKAVAVRNSLLDKFSGKFRRCWKILHRLSRSTKCFPCQGLGVFWQGKWLLENRPRLRERSWISSSETATAFLSFSECFRMGAPESAQNSKCGSIQPQHDLPHLLCEETMILNSSKMPENP